MTQKCAKPISSMPPSRCASPRFADGAAVAKGHIMNYLEDMETATEIVDQQLTDIMILGFS